MQPVDVEAGLTPSQMLLQGVTEGPTAVVEGCCYGTKLTRINQVISIAVVVGAVAIIILMACNILPLSPWLYGVFGVMGAEATKDAIYTGRVITLGGFDAVRQRLEHQTTLLSREVDRLDPITKSLEHTNEALHTQTGILQERTEQLTREIDSLTSVRAGLEEERGRLRGDVESLTKVQGELQEENGTLKRTVNALQGVVKTISSNTDLQSAQIQKELELQRREEEMIAREEALLKLMAEEVHKLQDVTLRLEKKKGHCGELAAKVIHAGISVRMLRMIKESNPDLYNATVQAVREGLVKLVRG